MGKYSVIKYYGHFRQCWSVKAESKEEAWEIAEKIGRLEHQSVYATPIDIESPGYVVDLDANAVERPPISTSQYNQWMREAILKGMVVRSGECDEVFGIHEEEIKFEE